MADVRTQVALSIFTDFEGFSQLMPAERHVDVLNTLIDEVIAWSKALAPLRTT